jgi:hypothetical protein
MINQEHSSKKILMVRHILKSLNPKNVKINIKNKDELEKALI